MARRQSAATDRRRRFREEFFTNDAAWTGENDKGWFKAPRTLPLILELISSKSLSGNVDPTRVYLELLSRHIDEGLVEMTDDNSHAYAAGYFGTRAVRTWQERMNKLEELGFIKTKQIGNQRFKFVLLVHPTVVVANLRKMKKIEDVWWDTYRMRQIEVREESFEERLEREALEIVQKAVAEGSPIPF